jgi:hypothetical protein
MKINRQYALTYMREQGLPQAPTKILSDSDD